MSKKDLFKKKDLTLISEELNKMREDFLSCKPKIQVIIDPDDDFHVESVGKDYELFLNKDGLFEINLSFEKELNNHDALANVLNGLKFIPHGESNKKKISYILLELLKTEVRNTLNETGTISIGGNNHVYVNITGRGKEKERFVTFGDLLIDFQDLTITKK